MQGSLYALLGEAKLHAVLREALACGGDFAEVYVERSVTHSLSLQRGALFGGSYASVLGLGVRVFAGTEVGYAFTDVFDDAALRGCARVAASVARFGKGSHVAPQALGPVQTPARYPMDRAPMAVKAADKGALLLRADAAARAADARVAEVMGGFVDQTRDVLLVNSEGTLAEDRQTMCRLSISAVAVCPAGNERHSGYAGGGGRVGFEHYETVLRPEAVGREAARMAVAQLGARPAPAGPQTVVLSPGWSGILLHEAVGHGLEADFIHKRTSLFAGKLGQRVASPLCTVIDSATPKNLRGSLNVDDEGAVPGERVLIENGILRGYLVDKLSARVMNTKSTGSGRRQSYRHAPMPRMSNTYMAAGPHDPDEIVASVKRGLYCAAFGGGQVDITNGNFVFEVQEGYMIEDGKLTYPVTGATLIGVGPVAMQRVSMVGNNPQFDPGIGTCGKDGQSVPVGVGMPTVRLDDITVGGTGG